VDLKGISMTFQVTIDVSVDVAAILRWIAAIVYLML
jgi:hypothetical protein